MSDPAAAGRLLDAERGVKLARDRLGLTVAELQTRLDPHRLATKAKRRTIDTGTTAARASSDAAHASMDAARANPGAVAGVAAAMIVFLARHRLTALFHRSPAQTPPDPATDPHPPR